MAYPSKINHPPTIRHVSQGTVQLSLQDKCEYILCFLFACLFNNRQVKENNK